MAARSLGIVLLLFLSGCAANGDEDTGTSTSPSPTEEPTPHPKQVLDKQGNDDTCSGVLAAEVSATFTVDAGYDRIEVGWHASGIGVVGFEIRDAEGVAVTGRDDYNPGTPPPCSHEHPPPERFDAAPGNYSVVVRNQGAVGWHLTVFERSSGDNSTQHAAEGGP